MQTSYKVILVGLLKDVRIVLAQTVQVKLLLSLVRYPAALDPRPAPETQRLREREAERDRLREREAESK